MEETSVSSIQVAESFSRLRRIEPLYDYNYRHFHPKYFVREAKRTLTNRGVQPGQPAPDFELPDSAGNRVRLSNLRGRPVLLTFGSYT